MQQNQESKQRENLKVVLFLFFFFKVLSLSHSLFFCTQRKRQKDFSSSFFGRLWKIFFGEGEEGAEGGKSSFFPPISPFSCAGCRSEKKERERKLLICAKSWEVGKVLASSSSVSLLRPACASTRAQTSSSSPPPSRRICSHTKKMH